MTNIEQLRERAKKIKLFATDLDGTLLDSKHLLREETQKALVSLSEKGIIVAVATGRALSSIPETILSLKGLKYLITANGATLYLNDTKELIYEKFLSVEALDLVIDLFNDPDVMCEVFWGGTPYVELSKYNDAMNYGIPKWFSSYFFDSRKPLEDFYSTVRNHENVIENINFIFGNETVKNRIYDLLEKNTDHYSLTSSFHFNFEIGGIGVSKSSAVDFLAKREGISQDETICFGDNDNDVTMIEYAGIGIATANAVPRAISAADYITEDNDSEGVASALKILGLV